MTTSNILNIIGLCFDIFGVVLLFYYEPPKEEHTMLLESAPSEEERDRTIKRKRIFSKLALALLIIGFAIQIFANLK